MKPVILVTAYAVNPFRGSEDGTGWNIIRHLAQSHPIVAVTRRNNRESIDQYFEMHPAPAGQRPEFLYFDLPYWLSFWKKGGRGALLYHYLWHLGVVFFILKRRVHFDVAHHLNFHSDWTPSFLWLLGKPFVWGPVGHHAAIPAPFIRKYGAKAWLLDRLRWWTKQWFWTFDPFLKITKWKAARVIGVNSSVQQVLRAPGHRFSVIPAIASEPPRRQGNATARLQVLSIGRFVPLKGFDVTIRAFADCYHRQAEVVQDEMCLTLIGKGPEKQRLQAIAKECRLPATAIRFVDWLNRNELALYFEASRVFFFPSHEGAGMVIPEALSYGIPVLCFDNFGPGELCDDSCAIRIPYTPTYAESIDRFACALERLLTDDALHAQLAANAVVRFDQHFNWERKAEQIGDIYHQALKPGHENEARPQYL